MTRSLVFLCVANSARSQMAEGLARRALGDAVRVQSAGSAPSSLSPFAVEVMREIGVDLAGQRAKSIAELDDVSGVDTVITLCAEEVCPLFPGPVRRLHWSIPDPAAGDARDREAGLRRFRAARDAIHEHLAAFVAARDPERTDA